MEKDFLIAGFGGQGVLLAGEVLANGFMIENKNDPKLSYFSFKALIT